MPDVFQRAGEAVRGAVRRPRRGAAAHGGSQPPVNGAAFPSPSTEQGMVDLQRRRDQLNARVAELQWDLGGLVYEMAIRDRIRVDVLVKRGALLHEGASQVGDVERIR